MNLYSAIVAIVAIWALVQVVRYWSESRRDAPGDRVDSEQIQALEDRIRTLERIVTDDRESLRRRFDEL